MVLRAYLKRGEQQVFMKNTAESVKLGRVI